MELNEFMIGGSMRTLRGKTRIRKRETFDSGASLSVVDLNTQNDLIEENEIFDNTLVKLVSSTSQVLSLDQRQRNFTLGTKPQN